MLIKRASTLLLFLLFSSSILQAAPQDLSLVKPFQETDGITIEPEFCSIFPITVPADLLQGASGGDTFQSIPLGTGPGNYNWLSWNGTNDANSIATRLQPPGNSYTYVNPHQSSDNQLNVGDWVQGAPGVKNSKGIRTAMDALLNQNIILPVYSGHEGNGSNLNYAMSQFAIVRLTDYQLNGKGFISFEFERFTRCYDSRPVANNLTIEVNEGDSVTFELSVSDADNDELVHMLNSSVKDGELSKEGDLYTYTPTIHFTGTDSFLYQAHDSEQISNEATVIFNVIPVNHAPTAMPGDAGGIEDEPVAIYFEGADFDGDVLTFIPDEAIEHGFIEQTSSGFQFIPEPNYNGTVTFNFIANDGELNSEPATYLIDILPVNDAPVAEWGDAAGIEDEPVGIHFEGRDIEGDPITFIPDEIIEHGYLEQTSSGFMFIPEADYNGMVKFNFVANDGELNSAPATFFIDIMPVNDAPVVADATYEMEANTALTVELTATDIDSSDFSFLVVEEPDNGQVTVLGNQLTYTPVNGYAGADVISYVANDGVDNSNIGYLTFNVVQENTPPEIVSSPELSAFENELYEYTVVAIDEENDPLLYSLTNSPGGMSIDPDTGHISWLPQVGQSGFYTISVLVKDDSGLSDTQDYVVSVEQRNQPPSIVSEAITLADENVNYVYQVEAIDPNIGDTLIFSLIESPTGMEIAPSTGEISWLPTNDQIGIHAVNVRVSDDGGLTDFQSYEVSVNTAENRAPIITSTPLNSIGEKSEFITNIEAIDPDFDAVTYSLSGFSENTLIDRDSGILSWQGDGNFPVSSSELNPMCSVSLNNDIPLLNATNWVPLFDKGGHAGRQSWSISPDGTTVSVRGNGAPSILLSDQEITDGLVEINLRVVGGDDDALGFVWGFQNMQQYYAFRWVESNGWPFDMEVLKVNTPQARFEGHDDTDETLWSKKNTPWARYVDYRILLDVRPGRSSIFIFQDNDLIESFQVQDAEYTSGRFGFYVHSQDSITYSARLLPRTPSADLMVQQIEHVESEFGDEFNITVLNRGAATTSNTTDLVLNTAQYSSNSDHKNRLQLASIPVSILHAGESEIINVTVPRIAQGYDLIEAIVDETGKDILECSQINNVKRVPFFRVNATDPEGLFDSQSFVVNRINVNDKPEIKSAAPVYAVLGETYMYNVIATDIDLDDALSYTLIAGPENMQFFPGSGLLVWTPIGTDLYESYPVTIAVTDLAGAAVEQSFTVTVQHKPTITSEPPVVAREGQAYQYQVTASDPENDTLEYKLLRNPAGMEIDATMGLINWVGTTSGQFFDVVVEVTDNKEGSDQQRYTVAVLKVGEVNTPPEITSEPVLTGSLLQNYQYQVVAFDVDGDKLRYRLLNAPAAMLIDQESGLIRWLPGFTQEGGQVVVEVNDGRGGSTEQSYYVSTTGVVNYGPEIVSTPTFTGYVGEQYNYDVEAIDPEGDAIEFFMARSLPGLAIDSNTGLITWLPTATDIGLKELEVGVADEHGSQTKQYFMLNVLERVSENHSPVITSVPNGAVYADKPFSYQVTATDADGDELSYSVTSEESTILIDHTGLLTWVPDSALIGSSIDVNIFVDDSHGGIASQKLTLPVNGNTNHPPIITSTPNTSVTTGDNYDYVLTATDADGDAFTFELIENPNGMALISDVVKWVPSSLQAKVSHAVIVKVTDAHGAASTQSFSVFVNEALTPNTAPTILSTPTSPAYVSNLYEYVLVANDAEGDALSYSLDTEISGAALDVNGRFSWTPTADQIGTHSITLRVSDSRAHATQTFMLDVAAEPTPDGEGKINTAPEITSYPRTETAVTDNYQYQLIANDADGDALTYNEIELPAGAVFSESGLLTWMPTTAQTGIHDVILSVSDGQIRAVQSFTIAVFDEALPIDVFLNVAPQNPNFGDLVDVQLLANGGTGTLAKTLTINGVEQTLDQYGRVSVLANIYGVNDVVATVTDGTDTITEESYFSVIDPLDTTAPTVSIASPTDGSSITAPSDVIGTVNDANLRQWRLIVKEKDSLPTEFQVIAEGTQNIDNALLDVFDPTMMHNGQYSLILEAEDANGLKTQDVVSVVVEGDLKIGNFSITFEDLNVPVAGIPIRVTRTYDSRQRFKRSDFGYGWRVGYQDVKVHESRTPGKFWALNEYAGAFGIVPNFCVEPMGAPVVTITLPGGDVEQFELGASPRCNMAIPITDVNLVYQAVGDTQSTLEALDHSTAKLVNGHLVETSYFSEPVNPDRYKLTTQAGYVYFLNQDFGVEKIIDPNDHTLTFSDNGILHSSGKSIEFVRNAYGQIEQIIDPAGNILEYKYDLNGDLTNAVDAVAYLENEEGSRYTYHGLTHGLDEIFDPLGRRVLKNVYDNDGRLDYQEDNNGNIISFDHDLVGRTSTVTDREFRSTVFAYDDQGNVLNEIKKAQGVVYSDDIESVFAYDANGNQTSGAVGGSEFATTAKFDAANNQEHATNALGQTVFYRGYNEKGQEGQIEDELGRLHDMHYDVGGNLYLIEGPTYLDPDTSEAKRNKASNSINSRGLVTSTTDMNGTVTTYTYYAKDHNWADQKWTESTTLSGTTTFTYDDNLNVKTETRERTINGVLTEETVSYDYDAQNRPTKTTFPDGSYTQTSYDIAGNAYEERDRFGVWTEHEFDQYSRSTDSYYADGTSEHWTYYPEGNLETHTSRSGMVTYYEYDDFGRQWKVHNQSEEQATGQPSYTETQYTPQGWVQFEWDTERNLTEYKYNVAGQRTDVIRHDDKGNTFTHTFTYYANDELHTETDANGHTTTYEINEQDQRIKTLFHDLTATQAVYDAMGTRTHSIDQNNRSTRFGYDSLGRLTEVQPEVQVLFDGLTVNVPSTTYSYDEAGNKVSQTDANGHKTKWTYDYFGRERSRSLPEGQNNSTEYSTQSCTTAATTGSGEDICQAITHTDFNGQVSTTVLDQLGRTERIDFSDGSFKAYTYWPGGQVNTITTEAGVTTYTYDKADRLKTETQPSGNTLTYGYDRVGNRTKLTVSQDGIDTITDFSFDALNRLKTVTDTTGTITYGYDKVGNLDTIDYPNGNQADYDYTELNQLWQLTITNASNVTLQHYVYDLDSTGRREFITEHHSSRTIDNVFDNLYRLTGEHITDATNGDYHATYLYDLVGNRTYETIDGVQTAYSYNDNDWLTQSGGTVFGYDDNGSTVTETLDGSTITYGYNAQNQLVSTDNAGLFTTYAYNVNGIRTHKTENAGTIAEQATRYIVDSNRDYAQVLQEQVNGTTTVTYQYGHDLISQTRSDTSTTSFFHTDGLGSTRLLTNDIGTVTDSYNYEAFGSVLNQTGITENNYLFTGEQYDAGLDQYYLRARYYNQNTGRFTQMDTWMGNNQDPVTLHKYLYANADPVTYTDPTGNFSMGSVMSSIGTMGNLAMRGYNAYSNVKLLMDIARGDMTLQELALTYLAARALPPRLRRCVGRNSFTADTLVHTSVGPIPISEIKVGDLVWSYDESTGEKSLQEVVHLIQSEGDKDLVEVELEGGVRITATPEHPFYLSSSKQWLELSEFKVGELLYSMDGNDLLIKRSDAFKDFVPVFNITVNNSHTYFVSEIGILNHNAKPNRPCEPRNMGFSDEEAKIADYLRSKGRRVAPNPREGVQGAGRQGDAFIDGIKTEFKSLRPGATSKTIKNRVDKSLKGTGQAREIILDARGTGMSVAEAQRGIAQALGIGRGKLDRVTVIGDNFFIGNGLY